MINFTNCKEELNNYKGSEKKKTLIYDGKKYLVKFPDPIREKNKNNDINIRLHRIHTSRCLLNFTNTRFFSFRLKLN